MRARIPDNERERLAALRAYELLDTKPEAAFDAVMNLAANLCATPIAAISLVDEGRQWFKSQRGLGDIAGTTRDAAFCAHTILGDGILEVPDAGADARFADNPLVTGEPHIQFYAGVPLVDPNGMALGSICVIDRETRTLSTEQRAYLVKLAEVIVGIIVTRPRRSELAGYRRASHAVRAATGLRLKKRSQQLKGLTASIALVDRLSASR